MSKIKFIFYDSSEVDNVLFDAKMASLCSSVYRVDANQLFVNYESTPKDLYENLLPLFERKHIVIIGVDSSEYYGYHNSSLWKWLKEQLEA